MIAALVRRRISSADSGLQRTPADTPTYSRDLVRLSDRAKYLALYNIHCAHPIGIANVHTPAERRGGKSTLRLRFTGSYIQLHKDNSARQDPAESTEQA